MGKPLLEMMSTCPDTVWFSKVFLFLHLHVRHLNWSRANPVCFRRCTPGLGTSLQYDATHLYVFWITAKHQRGRIAGWKGSPWGRYKMHSCERWKAKAVPTSRTGRDAGAAPAAAHWHGVVWTSQVISLERLFPSSIAAPLLLTDCSRHNSIRETRDLQTRSCGETFRRCLDFLRSKQQPAQQRWSGKPVPRDPEKGSWITLVLVVPTWAWLGNHGQPCELFLMMSCRVWLILNPPPWIICGKAVGGGGGGFAGQMRLSRNAPEELEEPRPSRRRKAQKQNN